MTKLAAVYRRRAIALKERDAQRETALETAARLASDPGSPQLDEAATRAAESYLQACEKIEYLNALLDEGRARRTRPTDAPTPGELLLLQQQAQAARAALHLARAGFDITPALPPLSEWRRQRAMKPPKERPIHLLTPEQAQAQADAKTTKAQRKADAEIRLTANARRRRKRVEKALIRHHIARLNAERADPVQAQAKADAEIAANIARLNRGREAVERARAAESDEVAQQIARLNAARPQQTDAQRQAQEEQAAAIRAQLARRAAPV